jgi:hypothetical protein
VKEKRGQVAPKINLLNHFKVRNCIQIQNSLTSTARKKMISQVQHKNNLRSAMSTAGQQIS